MVVDYDSIRTGVLCFFVNYRWMSFRTKLELYFVLHMNKCPAVIVVVLLVVLQACRTRYLQQPYHRLMTRHTKQRTKFDSKQKEHFCPHTAKIVYKTISIYIACEQKRLDRRGKREREQIFTSGLHKIVTIRFIWSLLYKTHGSRKKIVAIEMLPEARASAVNCQTMFDLRRKYLHRNVESVL